MGEVYKISCECNYMKELHIGGGLASCNLNMINRVFSPDKFEEFNNYYKNKEIQSFYFENEISLCNKCKEIMAVEVLKVQLIDGSRLRIINDCHICGGKIEIVEDLLCPKCGSKMNIEQLGSWD